MDTELRLYTFTNYYLSSIQQGIQSGHAAVELFTKYRFEDETYPIAQFDMLYDWATSHKTFVCLNGGDRQGVEDIAKFFDSKDNHYPWAPFYEDDRSLGGIITSVAIVLPARIFETASILRKRDPESRLHKRDPSIVVEFDHRLKEMTVGIPGTQENPPQRLHFSEWEAQLMKTLNECGLAR